MAKKAEELDIVDIVNKKFGEKTLLTYGDSPQNDVEVISTGIPNLDKILGTGGFPKGRVVEVYGPEGSGKTTLTLHTMAECQKAGGRVAFIDAEHALDPVYAQSLGVDMDKVLLSQPDSAEQALEIIDLIIRSKQVDLIVLDSIAALAPRAELDGEFGDSIMMVIPRLMASAMRKFPHSLSEGNCLLLLINQLRDKPGMHGPTEATPGGRAVKFQASVRLDVRRVEALKDGEDVVGQKTRIRVAKNKLSAPSKSTVVDLIFGEGFSKESDLLDLAIAEGVIIKKGAWFSFEENNFAQGRSNARKALKEPEFFDKVKALVQ